ncbi:nucleoside phosphorylase [Hallella colorans]|uniref:nucleoside phosphorylase n=1 Tax=Hallella colorans TaxID=1703337 RepID=UPI002889D93D|nr:nucleoside phosphorylase [Hallella colorans]
MNNYFAESELIINSDGSIFHLHLRPEQMADKIILVGDPGRVDRVASHFDTKECEVNNREFRSVTGIYKGKRITAQSTGIGCDNIDIVLNEMDALANIDFKTRTAKPKLKSLTFVRVGTCGGLQPNTPTGTYVASVKSIGFDGLINFYANRDKHCDVALEKAFKEHVCWKDTMGNPYVAPADKTLLDQIAANDMVRGYTVACGGFFGPQGRQLRVPLADPDLNKKIESFEYDGLRVTNFEMESSAVAGLANLMGHKALTCCMVIANRLEKQVNSNYKNSIDDLIVKVLDRI